MKMLMVALIATVCAGSAFAGVEVGDKGPNYKFDKSWNLPDGADELDDFRGKIVMVERWATWCGPCMAQIPHLTEMHEKYGDKGFQILSTSNEDVGTIQSKMINVKNPTYGIVRADIGSIYETRGIPHCWVLDADGKCIFKGHPANVTNELVEEWIATLPPAKIDKELAKELKGAVKSFDKGEFGAAVAEARKVKETAEDDLVKTDADYIIDLVNKHIESHNGKIAKAREAGDLVAAGKALGEAAEQFKGSSEGDSWANELKELEKSDDYKDTVKASEELEKIREKLEDMRPSSARKKLEKIAEKYPNTPAGKEAGELAKRFED